MAVSSTRRKTFQASEAPAPREKKQQEMAESQPAAAALAKRHKPRYMEALRDRKEEEDTELEFRIGDFIIVLDDTGDMWEVVRGNNCGFMPKALHRR